jgi:hypothetical protein
MEKKIEEGMQCGQLPALLTGVLGQKRLQAYLFTRVPTCPFDPD